MTAGKGNPDGGLSRELAATLARIEAAAGDAPAVLQDRADELRSVRTRVEGLPLAYPTPGDVAVERIDLAGLPVDVLSLPGARTDVALLYLHGGGYIACSARTRHELAARIARGVGCSAVVPEYRLAPESPYPAAVEDAVACYTWLAARGQVLLAGDSAGGGLALAVLQRLRRAESLAPPRALALLSPWTDLTLSGASVTDVKDDPLLDAGWLRRAAADYAGQHDMNGPELSPLFADADDLAALPPTLVEVGTRELLLDDSTRFAAAASAAGADIELYLGHEHPHVWQVLADTPEARGSSDRIAAHLGRHLPC